MSNGSFSEGGALIPTYIDTKPVPVFVDGDTLFAPPEDVADIWERMCGCGRPYEVWRAFTEYLAACASRNYDAIRNRSGAEYWMAYTVDDLGWTTHGSSVDTAFLYDNEARTALAFLLEFGEYGRGTLSHHTYDYRDNENGWRILQSDEDRSDLEPYGAPITHCGCGEPLPLDEYVVAGEDEYCDACRTCYTPTRDGGGRWRIASTKYSWGWEAV